jgi:hypothetical protein
MEISQYTWENDGWAARTYVHVPMKAFSTVISVVKIIVAAKRRIDIIIIARAWALLTLTRMSINMGAIRVTIKTQMTRSLATMLIRSCL